MPPARRSEQKQLRRVPRSWLLSMMVDYALADNWSDLLRRDRRSPVRLEQQLKLTGRT